MVKIIINRYECISCGACWSSCSDVYEQNAEDTKSQLVAKFQIGGNIAEGKVEDNLAECARQGAEVCPVQIISVE